MDNPAVLDLLPTEQVRPGLEDLDTRPVEDVVGELLAAEAGVAAVLDAAGPTSPPPRRRSPSDSAVVGA